MDGEEGGWVVGSGKEGEGSPNGPRPLLILVPWKGLKRARYSFTLANSP